MKKIAILIIIPFTFLKAIAQASAAESQEIIAQQNMRLMPKLIKNHVEVPIYIRMRQGLTKYIPLKPQSLYSNHTLEWVNDEICILPPKHKLIIKDIKAWPLRIRMWEKQPESWEDTKNSTGIILNDFNHFQKIYPILLIQKNFIGELDLKEDEENKKLPKANNEELLMLRMQNNEHIDLIQYLQKK